MIDLIFKILFIRLLYQKNLTGLQLVKSFNYLSCILLLSLPLALSAVPLDQKYLAQALNGSGGEPIALIRKGAGKDRVVQGLAIDSKNQFIYSSHVTGNPEKAVINRFHMKDPHVLYAIDVQSPFAYIGHQGITVDSDSGHLYTSSGTAVENHGWYITKLQYTQAATPSDFKVIRIFDKSYSKTISAMPAISPDSKVLVIRARKNNQNLVRVYDFSQFKKHEDDVAKLAFREWPVADSFTQDKYPFQAITTDGKYVYLMSGKSDTLPKRLYIYDLDGNIVQKIDDLRIGYDDAYDFSPTGAWEPEGLAIDAKAQELLLFFALGDPGSRIGRIYRMKIQYD